MEAQDAAKIPLTVDGSEATIEIKIKTLDSQTYTLKVDKQMPVPALKEQIATVTGVLSDQQRLICRGKVLKDDQLLSAYHVEDGHTLHLVVRQPLSEPLSNQTGNEPSTSVSRGHTGRSGPSMVIETFSMPDQGDGISSDISRIVSAVLGSFGFPNIGGGFEVLDSTRDRGMQTEQGGSRIGPDQSHATFGLPTAVPFGPVNPPVVTDSLTIMSQYLSHLRREFTTTMAGASNAEETRPPDGSDSSRPAGISQERFPTPGYLAEVLLASRQFLTSEVQECLLQLGRQLEDQSTITDPATRSSAQSHALRTGFQLYNLGALLLELGRTVMTLRLGQAPSEAVVNAGPAVFINASSPNPLMVQPLPFQWGSNFGNVPTNSGTGSVVTPGFLPRRIDIQIRRGSSIANNENRREEGDNQQPQEASTVSESESSGIHTNLRVVNESSSHNEDPSVRVVPIRTMVAALPATFSRLPFDSNSSMGLYYPLLGRYQNLPSDHANPSPAAQQQASDVELQMHNIERRIREASSSRHSDESNQHSININLVSDGDAPDTGDQSEENPTNTIFRFMRNLFSEGEMQVEEVGADPSASVGVAEEVDPSSRLVEGESSVSDDGLFLCNFLHQIMPIIADQEEPRSANAHMSRDSSTQTESAPDDRPSVSDSEMPNAKRRKMD